MILSFVDNDLYKFTTMNAIQKLYPEHWQNMIHKQGRNRISQRLADALQKEVDKMAF